MRRTDELPAKICPVCGRPFRWRKKWARDWERVVYCSERCRRQGTTSPAGAGPLLLAALVLLLCSFVPALADGPTPREVRCLALVAYAEAAVDGVQGMSAVIRVVRNRMADPRFPDEACAVIAQALQFQPIAQSAVLKKVVQDPEGYSIPQVLGLRTPDSRRLLVKAHELARAPVAEKDPTGGALYFVNPDLMNPTLCPWFAALKRTVRIGGHVFMTHYRPGERPGPPALECGEVEAKRAAAE
jgi:hypothetical protein